MTARPTPRYLVQREPGPESWCIFDVERLIRMGHYSDRGRARAAALIANMMLEQAEEAIEQRILRARPAFPLPLPQAGPAA